MASVGNFLLGGLMLLGGGLLLALGGPALAELGTRLLLTGALTIISSFLGAASGRGGFNSSPTYGWDGSLANSAGQGSPIPVVYGEHNVSPAFIAMNVKPDGDKQVMYLLMGVSEGPIESIGQVRINDQPISSFPGAVAVVDRLGTSDQTAITDFNQLGTPHDVGSAFVGGDASAQTVVTYEMYETSDEVAFLFTFGALYKQKTSGGIESLEADFVVEYAAVGTSPTTNTGWTKLDPLPSESSTWKNSGSTSGTWRTSGKSTSPVYRQIRIALNGATTPKHRPARGRYTFRIRAAWSSTDATYVRPVTLTSVLELNSDSRAYPYVALLALKLPAMEQLSGGRPKVSCVAKGRKCEDPRSGETAYTTNPFVCARDFILNTRFGLGRWYSSADLHEASGETWRDCMDACDDTVTPITGGSAEPRHTLNYVLDVRAPASEHLTQMLMGARGHLYPAQRKVRATMDVADSSIRSFECRLAAAAANRRNILDTDDGVSTLTAKIIDTSERITSIRVNYIDKDRGWTQQSFTLTNTFVNVGAITGGPYAAGEQIKGTTSGAIGRIVHSAANASAFLAYVQGDDATAFQSGETITGLTSGATCTSSSSPYTATPDRPQEVNLYGVTRRSQAIREARYHLNLARLSPVFASWGVFLGDLDVLPGDKVDVSADFIAWTSKVFTVLSTGFDDEGRGVIEAREYSADVYVDNLDTAVADASEFQQGGRVPASSTNNTPPQSTDSGGSSSGGGAASGNGSGTGTPPSGSNPIRYGATPIRDVSATSRMSASAKR